MAITKVKGSVDGSVLDNIEALLSASQSGQYTTLGYHTAGDGGGGEFYWDVSGNAALHDGINIIDPDQTFDWTNNTTITTWFTAGTGTGVWKRVNPVYSTKAGGCKVDGSQDDSVAAQNVIDAWLSVIKDASRVPAKLIFSEGEMNTSQQLLFTFDGIIVNADVDFSGCKINSTIAGTDSVVKMTSTSTVRGITFHNLYIEGSGNENYGLEVDGGNQGAGSRFFYNMTFLGMRIEACKTPLRMYGNYFESAIYDMHLVAAGTTAGTYAAHLSDLDDGATYTSTSPSSIDIYGGSTRNGQYGLYLEDVSDVKIFGGTYIEAGEYNIYYKNGTGALLSGVHLENAHMDGAGSDNAAIYISGQGAIRDCFNTSNNGFNDTLVEIFANSNGVTVDKPRILGGVSKAILAVSGTGRINTYGVKRSLCTIPNIAAQRNISFNNNKNIVKSGGTTSGNITIDVDEQEIYEVTVNGNTNFQTPTNGVAGDHLYISVVQDGTGTHAVGFLGFSNTTAASTTAGERTTYHFYYTGGAWIEIAATTV